MHNKKGAFTDLLYLALIVSVLRTNNNQIDENVFNEQYGGSSVDEFGPTTAVNIYLHNLRNSYSIDANIYSNSAKTNILLEETLDILREVNSLGRYARQPHFHNSNLFAYLVNSGDGEEPAITAAIASTSSSSVNTSEQQLHNSSSDANLNSSAAHSSSEDEEVDLFVSVMNFEY